MAIDISTIAETNRRYAIHLATRQKIVQHRDGRFELKKNDVKTPHTVIDFYRDISLACELMLKSCLLQHRVNFFKRRENSEYGEKVTARHNEWLQATLDEKNIVYISQINTGTAAMALKKAETLLYGRLALEKEQADFISKVFYLIIRTRRNRDNHFFFPNMARFDAPEVEMFYLPLLNTLESIYRTLPLA